MSNGNGQLNGSGKTLILQVIISVLLVLVAVFATSGYQTTRIDKKFIQKDHHNKQMASFESMLKTFHEENREEHREMRSRIQKMARELDACITPSRDTR